MRRKKYWKKLFELSINHILAIKKKSNNEQWRQYLELERERFFFLGLAKFFND